MRAVRGLALLATMLFIASVIAACGGSGETADQPPKTPQGLAEVAAFDGVHSGEVEITVNIARHKKQPEAIKMRMLGNFIRASEGKLPEIDTGMESHGSFAGNEVDFNSGLVLSPERLVISYGPTGGELVYQPDKGTFEELKSNFEEALGEGGKGDAGACLGAAGDFNLAKVLSHISSEGKSETEDGTRVEILGADLNVPAAIEELTKLSEDEGCRAQLEALRVPVTQLKALEEQLNNSLASARVKLEVDHNEVIRYVQILMTVELPGNEKLEAEFYIRLNKINEVTELPKPVGELPIGKFLKKFGVDLQQVEEADSGERLIGFLEAAYRGMLERGSP
ncbi:MAG: hypothetical protein ACTHKT_11030 [Solirubrobacterales bacterium]